MSYTPSFRLLITLLTIISSPTFALPQHSPRADAATDASLHYDVVIYGNSPSAITAAIQVKRMDKTVAIVSPDTHLGGLTASGLGWTDSKNGEAIGGIARDFYGAVYRHYLSNSTWDLETRDHYLARNVHAQPGPAIDTAKEVQWTFEPKVAEQIFEIWVKDQHIPVYRGEFLDRSKGAVQKSGTKITSFKTLSGKVFTGGLFIDAGYEGDLMAAAGVSYHVGRDAASTYGESLAGKRMEVNDLYKGVDPYVRKGDSTSGLLKGIQNVIASPTPDTFSGSVDNVRIQSFNYRLTLTKSASNKVAIAKPANYNAADFELALRSIEAGLSATFTTDPMPNLKTDSNSKGVVSFDLIGGNYNGNTNLTYSEATYEQRNKMIDAHRNYQQGFLWTLANDPRVPADKRKSFSEWGLAKDEFVSNGNWPYAIYIREARRMVGMHTLKQQEIQSHATFDAVAGLGAYSLDCHTVRRLVQDGKIYDEGHFYVVTSSKPYQIPYETLVPQPSEVTNLLNPVTISATHVAYGSVRMEPVYMVLGQTAGTAAVMAIEQGTTVQAVDRTKLNSKLLSDKQRLA